MMPGEGARKRPKKKEKESERTLSQSGIMLRTSLVVQWISMCLPVQGTQVQSPVQEQSTRLRATEPVLHTCRWPCAYSLCPAAGEAAAVRRPVRRLDAGKALLATTGESPPAAMQTQRREDEEINKL